MCHRSIASMDICSKLFMDNSNRRCEFEIRLHLPSKIVTNIAVDTRTILHRTANVMNYQMFCRISCWNNNTQIQTNVNTEHILSCKLTSIMCIQTLCTRTTLLAMQNLVTTKKHS